MIAIVSACESELALLIELTSAVKQNSDIYTSDYFETELLLSPVGVGYLEAALSLRSILFKYPQINRVVFTGTVGAYPVIGNKLNIGELFFVKQTSLFDTAAFIKKSHLAPPLKKGPLNSSQFLGQSLSRKNVFTSLSLTLDESIASKIGEQGGELESMELFGIAQVCSNLNIAWDSLVGVTNSVGSTGSKDWFANHLEIEKKANQQLFEILDYGLIFFNKSILK